MFLEVQPVLEKSIQAYRADEKASEDIGAIFLDLP